MIAVALVTSPGFRWMRGMSNTAGGLAYEGVDRDDEDGPAFVRWAARHRISDYMLPDGEVPDLNDPATIGCLLFLAREAYDDPTLVPHSDGLLWVVTIYDYKTGTEMVVAEEYSEGEALAVAILAKHDARWLGPDGDMIRNRLS
jgi:hypothetical protein